ncbi:hypothetical protein CRG98_008732 [Punica granatum]|uniref:Uncharacterized protein n=1 Tax=Punica granatum TaxID=22663 RepID=A0A2I0KQU7_PUNGR|nr:hypothetical protein CRG98_008732 [Punica granatum]
MGHPQAWSSKRSSLASGPRGTVFVGRSPRKTSNSSISARFKGSSPRHTPSYRGAIRSWHVQTLPWRDLGRGPVEVRTHLRIDTFTRLSLGIGAFRGNATMHFCTTGESCQPSRVDHSQSSPLHGETCCDQSSFIPATHPVRQASHANLRGQATCGLHPSSMAMRATDRGPTHFPRRD